MTSFPVGHTDRTIIHDACLAALGINNVGSVYSGLLVQRLTEPHRHYHTPAHVTAMLRLLNDWHPTHLPNPLLLAALFHDVIYDPHRGDNEEQSALLCRTACAAASLPDANTAEAQRLILLTKTHDPAPDDPNGVLLTCADLWILGGTPDEYETYRQQVRQEYAHVPDEAWRTGRARVLRTFLERPRIFPDSPFAPPGTDEREASARRNIAGEIAALEGGTAH